jgi:uncharacterized protein YecE (DUF72 family)
MICAGAQLRAERQAVQDDFRFLVKAHEECTLVHCPKHLRYGNTWEAEPAHPDASNAEGAVIA